MCFHKPHGMVAAVGLRQELCPSLEFASAPSVYSSVGVLSDIVINQGESCWSCWLFISLMKLLDRESAGLASRLAVGRHHCRGQKDQHIGLLLHITHTIHYKVGSRLST